jgi:hypothetical protein
MRKAPKEDESLTFFCQLATMFPSDKWTTHEFQKPYHRHFSPLRSKTLRILEIGVGGYVDDHVKYSRPDTGGESLRFWKRYFPKSEIYALDIEDKSDLKSDRLTIFQGDQSDPQTLKRINESAGGFDIVIDDGSHINSHVITTFEALFPLLSPNGIYVVEDTQTSYWDFDSYGGSMKDLHSTNTTIGYFKRFADGLNHAEFPIAEYKASYFDNHIESIHFYHNILFIHKGINTRQSVMAHRYPCLNRN